MVLNAAPAKRDDKESPAVAQSRAFLDRHEIPVWSGQISQRAGYALTLAAGASACELEPELRGRRRDRGAVVGDRALGRGDQRGACRRPRGARAGGAGAGGVGPSEHYGSGLPRTSAARAILISTPMPLSAPSCSCSRLESFWKIVSRTGPLSCSSAVP